MDGWVIIKFEKLPWDHVMYIKSGLVSDEDTLSTSFDRYDPKEVSQCMYCDVRPRKKFS